MALEGGIWVPTPSETTLSNIRASLDALFGVPLDYIATADGQWTLMAAEYHFEIEQGIADALASMRKATASRETLVGDLLEMEIEPRPATYSRVTAFKNGVGVLPIGTQLKTATTIVPPFGPSVLDPQGKWQVVDNDSDNPADGAPVILESLVAGQVTANSPTAVFKLLTPVPGIVDVEYDEGAGSFRTVGKPEETTPELRSRFAPGRIGVGGSIPAMRRVLNNIDWVVASFIEAEGGVVSVFVYPGPIGTDQEQELAYKIYKYGPPGEWAGTEDVEIIDAYNLPLTIRYSIGVAEEVDVGLTGWEYDGSMPILDVQEAAQAAIQEYFSTLGRGDAAYWFRAASSANVPGLTNVDLTLNGGVANVFPSNATNILIPVFV